MTKADDYLTLKWWLEINKRTGHDNVYFCDHDIEKDPSFDALFRQYKDFIIFDRLKCIPNLQALKKTLKFKYFRKNKLMEFADTGQFDVTKYEVLMQLIQNVCYHQHFDKYRYIAAYDNDEVMINNLAENFFSLEERSTYVVNAERATFYNNKQRFDMKKVIYSFIYSCLE
jgi:hypothetical protein